jgi:ribosomal protein L11 methylase PrmA
MNLELLPELCPLISEGGMLLISGFLDFDLEDMIQEANKHGLQFVRSKDINSWQAALFIKNNR